MSEYTSGSPSRRAFVKSGLLSTAALVGSSSTAVAADPEMRSDSTDPDPPRETSDRGVMFPYQFTPRSRVTVTDAGVDWRPAGLEESYRAHVISYDRAPSLRAFLFTNSERSLEPDRSFELGTGLGSPAADRGFVTVGLEPRESNGG